MQVRIYVPKISEVIASYDQIKVERSDDDGATWAEISDADTRPRLLAHADLYLFEDAAGDADSLYRTRYYSSGDVTTGDPSSSFSGYPAGYVSLAEARAEGIDETAVPDGQLLALIDLWQRWFDDETRQWFEPRRLEITLDGDGSRMLYFGVPIIAIEALYLNDDFANAVPLDRVRIYNGRQFPDDRQDPRIMINANAARSVFAPPSVRAFADRFANGYQNQRIVGLFGYVERDGATPPLVKRAVLKMVKQTARKGAPLTGAPSPSAGAGQIVRVQVDRNSRTFQPLMRPSSRVGALSLVRDPEVDAIVNRYRAPRDVGVTGSDSIRS